MSNLYSQVDANKRKSMLIIGAFVAFVTGALYVMLRGFGYGPDVIIFAFLASSGS